MRECTAWAGLIGPAIKALLQQGTVAGDAVEHAAAQPVTA